MAADQHALLRVARRLEQQLLPHQSPQSLLLNLQPADAGSNPLGEEPPVPVAYLSAEAKLYADTPPHSPRQVARHSQPCQSEGHWSSRHVCLRWQLHLGVPRPKHRVPRVGGRGPDGRSGCLLQHCLSATPGRKTRSGGIQAPTGRPRCRAAGHTRSGRRQQPTSTAASSVPSPVPLWPRLPGFLTDAWAPPLQPSPAPP